MALKDSQFCQAFVRDMLGFINEQYRFKQGGLAMVDPAFTKGLEATIPVRRRKRHVEQFSQFPVKVTQFALGTLHDPDDEVGDFFQAAGHFVQGLAFAQSGFSGNEGKAPLAGHGTYPKFKRLRAR